MIPVLHSVSYAGLWGQDKLSLEEFIPHAAQLGYKSVMLMSKRPHLSALDYDEAKLDRLIQLLDQYQVSVACIAGYSDPNAGFTATSGPFAPLIEAQLSSIRDWARMAVQIKTPIIRLLTGLASTGETYYAQWSRCVKFMQQACDVTGELGITIGIQNHDDIAGHYLSMRDLIEEVNRPNCKACFDAWSCALQGDDVVEAAKIMAPYTIHTTIADYVKRPRFRYHHPGEGNVYERILDDIKAVPMGEGFIDYSGFLKSMRGAGFNGTVGYEMCSPIRGGGAMENLDRYAKRFLEYFDTLPIQK